MNYLKEIDQIILNALNEDVGTGDITTLASVPAFVKGKAELIVKEEGILAGIEIAERVFSLWDKFLVFKKNIADGGKVLPGDVIGTVEGSAASILTAERTMLNFLQRMSGIATLANRYNDLVKHTKAVVIDTRKTVPGLRMLDKMAVLAGGCKNHRIGLYDMFLIKDNHISAAGSITKAIEGCRKFIKKSGKEFKIEVETENLDQVREALESGVDIIMLDNYELYEMKKAVEFINGKSFIEASGGINLNTIKDIAETGVDFISVGAITHSVKALDISLEIILQ